MGIGECKMKRKKERKDLHDLGSQAHDCPESATYGQDGSVATTLLQFTFPKLT